MTDGYLLPLVLVVAGLGAAALVTVSCLALFRRQSLSYLLVTLAIGTLLLRSFLGTVMLGGLVSEHSHHLLEHLLDVFVIGLLFAAVFATRRIDATAPLETPYRDVDE